MEKNILFSLAFLTLLIPSSPVAPVAAGRVGISVGLMKGEALSCSAPGTSAVEKSENGKFIGPLSGWGSYHYAISTTSDSTQYYFNQGLTMYYSYHFREAVASFKEAARFDSGCAMAYWGQALAMGPYYNAAYSYKMSAGVPAVLASMLRNSSHGSAREQQLIKVMESRYPGAGGSAGAQDSLPVLASIGGAANLVYARGMKTLIAQYPDDLDIKALYIDAMMLIHPWDFWNNDGSAKAWTPELEDLCATLLKESPHHPAGLHYYIHLTEASRHPEKAFPNAEALKEEFPGIAHMVHMSSHEYERTGDYAKGVAANDKADDALRIYDSLARHLSLNRHSSHYYAVQAYCALSGAMYGKAMAASLHCRNSVTPTHEKTYEQYLYMMPALTLVRMGKWEEILRDSIRPDSRWPYAGVLYHFARGLAFVNTGHADSATGQLSQLREAAKDPVLTVRDIPFNTALQEARVAEGILQGAILFAQKKYDLALTAIRGAIQAEDGLIYREPKDWMIPARQFLGFFLLKLGKPVLAEKVYREDLVNNPRNGWSLLGACQSLQAQHKLKEASLDKIDYFRSFSAAERMPPASVYFRQ